MTTFADPMLATLSVLRTATAGLTFGNKPYEEFTPETAPAVPYVMVRNDGTDLNWPVSATASIAVTTWTTTEAEGYPLAYSLVGALRDHPGSSDVRSFSAHAVTLLSTLDPATGLYMTSFTTEARLRPRP